MINLILCEGETDAILLSYVMCNNYGWKYKKHFDDVKMITPNVTKHESANWYFRNNDLTLICGVGGNCAFEQFFLKYIAPIQKNNIINKFFENILVVCDRDDRSVCEIEESLSKIKINGTTLKFLNNSWNDNFYKDDFGQNAECKSYLLIIPENEEGALETVVLLALSEKNEKLIGACIGFVDKIKDDAIEYLKRKRDVQKAKLGVSFAVMSPMKVFRFIDELLMDVDWSKSTTINRTFRVLEEL